MLPGGRGAGQVESLVFRGIPRESVTPRSRGCPPTAGDNEAIITGSNGPEAPRPEPFSGSTSRAIQLPFSPWDSGPARPGGGAIAWPGPIEPGYRGLRGHRAGRGDRPGLSNYRAGRGHSPGLSSLIGGFYRIRGAHSPGIPARPGPMAPGPGSGRPVFHVEQGPRAGFGGSGTGGTRFDGSWVRQINRGITPVSATPGFPLGSETMDFFF